MHVLTVLALTLQWIGTYLVWPSRWNIPAHIAVGFAVTAYMVPGLATDVWGLFDDRTNLLYAQINIVGAVAMVAGLLMGVRLGFFDGVRRPFLALYESPQTRTDAIARTTKIAFFAVVGMVLAYAIMGFVPMFAEDPFAAKEFKNEYFEPYYRAAYLYRTCSSLLLVVIPLTLLIWWNERRRTWPLFLGLSSVALIAASLARQSAASGVLTFIGLLAARSYRGARLFVLFNAIVFPIGSAIYLVIGLLTGVERFTSIYSVDSLADIVSSGSTDIYDQLNFLNGFQDLQNFTYGRTFVGGLVPRNYMWNPSVWSLTYDSLGADISSLVTGGLRFSTALWGYASFGWVGVIIVPLLSGLISGSLIRVLKTLPLRKSIIATGLVMSVYLTLGKQLSEFYLLSIHNIPAIACAVFLCFGIPRLRRATSVDNGALSRNTHA